MIELSPGEFQRIVADIQTALGDACADLGRVIGKTEMGLCQALHEFRVRVHREDGEGGE